MLPEISTFFYLNQKLLILYQKFLVNLDFRIQNHLYSQKKVRLPTFLRMY